MKFEEYQALIPQYLAGQLTPAEKESFDEQLSGSADLRIEVEELRSVWQRLEPVGQEQPSAAMRAHFYQRLHAASAERREKGLGGSWRNWKIGLPQFAGAFTLFVLGILVGRVGTPASRSGPEVTQLRQQVEGLRQTVALSLLDRQSAISRLEGISWSSRVERPDQELLSALLGTLNHDRNVNVRLASLDALEKFADDASVRKSLEMSIPLQQSPLVQIALIDALVHLHDNGAAGQLQKLTSGADTDAAVRQRAQWGLQKLNYQ